MVTLSSGPCGECLYPLVSSPTLRAVSELVATSRCRPGQQHNFAAKSAPVDAGVDFARGRERQSVDHDRMKDARAQQLEQHRHVGLEFFRVNRSTCRDAVEDGATAAEKEAECASQLVNVVNSQARPGAARCDEPDVQRVRMGALFRGRGLGGPVLKRTSCVGMTRA